nr:alpha-hydroxy-acid oxidizing protein [Amycolatopsis pithecellobii]
MVKALDGRAEVYVDGGVMSGADIVAAVCLGATAALIGRAYLYGLMAAGERGVDRLREILRNDVRRTMQLLGATTTDELTADRVRFRARSTKSPPRASPVARSGLDHDDRGPRQPGKPCGPCSSPCRRLLAVFDSRPPPLDPCTAESRTNAWPRSATSGHVWAFAALTALPGARTHYDRHRTIGDRREPSAIGSL